MTDDRQNDLNALAESISAVVGSKVVVLPLAKAQAIRAALMPFSAFHVPEAPEDLVVTAGSQLAHRQLTMGDLRQADAVLQMMEGLNG